MTDTLDPLQSEQHRLITENSALQEMMLTEGWQVFIRYCERWKKEHEDLILSGGMTDPLAYRFHTGRLQGINQVMEIPKFVEAARDLALNPSEQYVDELALLDPVDIVRAPDEGD